MPYDVAWLDEAIEELGAILRANRHMRRLLVDDSNRIDEALAADPRGLGFPIEDDFLAAQIGRLQVCFTIHEGEKLVEVASVKLSL